jgi:hypothetical protein
MVDSLGAPYGQLISYAIPAEIERARKKVRFVFITGTEDFRRGNVRDLYAGGYAAYGFRSKLLDVQGMGHDVADGIRLKDALDFLEAR